MRKIYLVIAGFFLLLVVGCVTWETQIKEAKESAPVPQPEEEKKTVPEAMLDSDEIDIKYKLSSEIKGLMFLSPGENTFINLIDTKVDNTKAKKFVVSRGIMLAHFLEFNISSDNELEVYVVPSYEDYTLFDSGNMSFRRYDECSGLRNSCFISFYSGMIIVNKDNSTAKIYRNIRVYAPGVK